jgi:hypothetical protein
MCNYQNCTYAITDLLHEEGGRRCEHFLFCSFHDCLPEDCPPDCTPDSANSFESLEDYCAACHRLLCSLSLHGLLNQL